MADDKEQATDNTISFNLGDAYYEDEAIYPQYVEVEAEETVIPTESEPAEAEERAETAEAVKTAEEGEKAPEEAPLPSKRKVISPRKILSGCIDLVYTTGDSTIALLKYIVSKAGPFLVLPFALIFSAFSLLFGKLRDGVFRKDSKFKVELKEIIAERETENKKYSYTKAFFVYLFKGKRLLKTAFNLAFPILALLLVISVYGNVRDTVFALEVIYNGKSIGYIENEDVFAEGKNHALSLLSSGAQSQEAETLISEPVYKVRRVGVNELSNSGMVSESIITSSDRAYTRACGIYIDGAFLCAVKNESDALTVFESILEPYIKKAGSSESVAFVEEIEYVQGLYPEDSELIWSSAELLNTLSKPKSEAKYHKVQKGDTQKSVAKQYDLTVAQLRALNSDKDFSKPSEIKTLLVARQTNYVRVKVMRTRTRTEALPYETIKKNSSSLAKGTSKTSQKGAYGQKTITELVTYIDGVESYTTVLSEKQTKAPVNEIILVGTKTYTAASSGYTWPTRGAYAISSYYGYRSASISGWSFHGGLDIVKSGGGSSGTPVVAAASGTVEVAYSGYSGYGHTVVINHGNGIKTRYAHMYPGSIAVRPGQKVSKGQQIGKIGSTGNSTGPHLHFEVIVNGTKVNPLKYIR